MFRETETNPQMSLFDNPADLMGKRAVKKYEDPKALELVRMEDEAPSIDTYYLLRRRHHFGPKRLFFCHIGHPEDYVADFRASDFFVSPPSHFPQLGVD